MKTYRITIFFISVVISMLIPVGIFADTQEAIREMNRAASAYKSGDYSKAVDIYEGVMQMEGTSAASLFNLGNAYFKTGNLGRARLCYERAHRLSPRNKEISNNLAYVTSKIDDANAALAGKDKELVTQDIPSFWESVYNTIAVESTSDSWALMAIMAFVLLISAVAVYIFSNNVAARKAGFFSAIIFLLCAGAFVSLAFISASESDTRKTAVLIGYKVPLRKEPKESVPVAGPNLTQGTKLMLEPDEEKAGWYKVRLNSRLNGWVKSSDMEII